MKVLHVVESLEVGGLERVVISLAGYQAKSAEVQIACLFNEGALAPAARDSGIHVVACHKNHGVDIRALRNLRALIVGFSPDVIHSHNAAAFYYSTLANVGLPAKLTLNTRHGMGDNKFSWRREFLFRIALSRSDYAVAVCRQAYESFLRRRVFSKVKARIVRNGIDLVAFTRGAHKEAPLSLLPSVPVVFGTVGRLSPAKNHRLLLRAFAALRREGIDCKLRIVGDGALRGDLERLSFELNLEDSIEFVGERNDIPEQLAAMDVFVLSSDTEGYSLALVEASAAGLPIICTKVGGNEEIVEDAKTGIVVPASDESKLIKAMRHLAGDSVGRRKFGAAGRAWAIAYGSLEAMHQAYQNLYHREQ